MSNRIKVLHLEESVKDADLVEKNLKEGEINADLLVVDNKEAYIEALIEFAPDVILANHTVSSFNAGEALNIFLHTGIKIPFILVTCRISEEYAVSVMKAGAHDYILKDHLDRLPEAITHALEKIETGLNLENDNVRKMKEKTNAVLIAQETERSQMTNQLLENINQILAISNIYIDYALSDEEKRMAFMANSKKCILMAIDEIKNLSQVIMPPTTDEVGLTDSLDNWIKFKYQSDDINFVTDWVDFNEQVIDNNLQLTIYRIAQEQLNNTINHSHAQNVSLSLHQTADSVDLTIKDDGVGFDPLKGVTGTGFKNIHTRAQIHNGKILLNSAPGRGCMLTVVFPL